MQLVAGCPPCLDRQTHIYTWSACLLAVDHGLTWRTGDGPVIKHWRYHSSSHLYSPSSPSALHFFVSLSLSHFLSLNDLSLHLPPSCVFYPLKSVSPSSSLSPKSLYKFACMYKYKISRFYQSNSLPPSLRCRLILFAQMKLRCFSLAGDSEKKKSGSEEYILIYG